MSTLVSVDLDDPGCYHAIYGLEPPPPERQGLVLERALPRFLELFEKLSVRATFFVIGRDLRRDLDAGGKGAEHLRAALAAGHELANHSYAHDYRMHEWATRDIQADLVRGDEVLRELGAKPVGFRAPGYIHDSRMLVCVGAMGYRYDSSTLPSPPYLLAKLGVLGWMKLRGQRSASASAGASSFFGATRPRYHPEAGVWQIPIGVSRLRLPFVGTFVLAGPEPVGQMLRREAASTRHLHLELHGIDLADESEDGWAEAVVARAPELKTPLATRLERLEKLLESRGGGQTIAAAVGEGSRLRRVFAANGG